MKNFNDDRDTSSLRDLKYENLFKIVKDGKFESDDAEGEMDESEMNDECLIDEEDEEEINETDDGAIEITKDEYNIKVNGVMNNIFLALKKTGKNLNELFHQAILPEVQDFRAVELGLLIQILKEELGLELTHIDVFCMFTKIKPGVGVSENFDNSETVDEIVDYDKFVEEVEKIGRIMSNVSVNQGNNIINSDVAGVSNKNDDE
jgi:hypothetical protein